MKILFDRDKQKHAIIGALLGLTCIWFPNSYVYLIGCLIAIGKEVYDYYHPAKHTPDVSDALVTIGALSLSIVLINFFARFF
jgi:hypothetical protein